MKKQIFFLALVTLVACHDKKEETPVNNGPEVIEAPAYAVPTDSLVDPKIISIDESKHKKVPLAQSVIIPVMSNIHLAGEPEVILAGNPQLISPGTDTFSLPNVMPAIDSSFVAGLPEVGIVKDAYIKDYNPQNFSSFKKLQGLKMVHIYCLMMDKSGNLWMGSSGGGATKYDGKHFTHYTTETGLSGNIVSQIIQDKSGNIWFGLVGEGVSKFDGTSFTHYGEEEGLNGKIVSKIIEDKSGCLWICTLDAGVSKYDGTTFTHFTTESGLAHNKVRSVMEDKAGNLWFGLDNGSVSNYDGKVFRNFSQREGLNGYPIYSIMEDRSGAIWFGSLGGGVLKLDGTSFISYTRVHGLNSDFINDIFEDRDGNIWFATMGDGVSKFDGTYFTHFSDREGLSHNNVQDILEDKFGNLWFGTFGGGISRHDGKIFTHFTERDGLAGKAVNAIFQDNKGNLWFGSHGGGSTKFDGKNFYHFTQNEGFVSNFVNEIMEDKSGNIWFANTGGVMKFDGTSFTYFTDKDGLIDYHFTSILEDRSGAIWIGTGNNGLFQYDGKTLINYDMAQGLSDNVVTDILEDRNGNLWCSTVTGGITKIELNKDGSHLHSYTHYKQKEELNRNYVIMMLEDSSGNLWFGTKGGGLIKYDGINFTHYTEEQGLKSNTIVSALQDRFGNIWFGTPNGISKLSVLDQENSQGSIDNLPVNNGRPIFTNYTYDEGFLGVGCRPKSLFEDTSGTIWIGAHDRLTAYHPPAEEATDTSAPNIQLMSISLFNENINWIELEKNRDSIIILGNGVQLADFEFDGLSKWYSIPENLSLSHNNNYITFSFIGITLHHPKKVRYKYKLEGIDKNWSALTDRTEATYGNLPHGDYIFKIKAMNGEEYWSEELHYTFTVRPPWWKTLWFRLLYISAILIFLFLIYRWRTATLRKQKEVLEMRVQERTFEIVEQKQLIEEKHKEITDSINYAERIQRSFLATQKLLDENLKDYFVFFLPKDVVSGDFYWATKLSNGKFALVTADSTGHGVPGAIMSIANIACLKESVTKGLVEPHEIFNETRRLIIEYLKNDGSEEGGKDGMDASLISFDFRNKKLIYSAANNPIWIVRKNEILEFAADKMPVGKHDKQNIPFKSNQVDLESGDVIYTLTDGIADQFGGEKGKKFMYKKLKQLLISMAKEPMQLQNEKLKKVFVDWKGELEQVDDVCIVGIKI